MTSVLLIVNKIINFYRSLSEGVNAIKLNFWHCFLSRKYVLFQTSAWPPLPNPVPFFGRYPSLLWPRLLALILISTDKYNGYAFRNG